MRKILLYSLAAVMMLASSCKSKNAQSTGDQAGSAAGDHGSMMGTHGKKYGIKSGIITFSVEVMNEKQVKKVYFDDYGIRETSEVYVQDKLIEKLINKADGFVYLLSVDKGTGIRSKHAMATGTEMKFDVSDNSIPDSIKKMYHFAKLANETVCGKDCEAFSTEFQNTNVKYAGWNGIVVLTETTMNMGQTKLTTKVVATKIEENVEIPSTVWDVPAGVKLTDQ